MNTQENTQQKGIIAWFTHNSVAANLLMITIFIVGIVSVFIIRKEAFPDLELNIVTVSVPYLGGTPQEVEEGVCIKIEEAIKDIDGIDEVTSIASEGIGRVTIEVDSQYDLNEVMDEIKVVVDSISTFPAQTERPIVQQRKNEQEILYVAVYGDIDELTMKRVAENVRDEITALDGISKANVLGVRDFEIAIELSEIKLREYNLTFDDVVRAVNNSSLDLPAGSIKTNQGDILLRTKGQAYNQQEFSKIVLISRADGTKVKLGDVATVIDGFEEDLRHAYFDGKPTLNIEVMSVGNQNELEISRKVNRYIAEKQEELPEGVSLAIWADISYYLKGRLNLMLKNLFFGGILVFIILTLFLRLKLAFWVIIGIPVSFLGTFALMSYFGVTVNLISLFAFILVLGIVVDDAIIIGESIYTTVRKEGYTIANVIKGAKKVAMTATFGVLTTMVAFIPMLMIGGNAGPIWMSIGIIVMLCLVFSLVESKLILPAHLKHMKPLTEKKKHGKFNQFQRFFSLGLESFVINYYQPLLNKALHHRYLTFCIFVSALILTVGIIGGDKVKFKFFPDIPSDFIQARVDMHEGSPTELTLQALDQIQEALVSIDNELEKQYGQPMIDHIFSFNRSNTNGMVFAELVKGEMREIDAIAIKDMWREKTGNITGIRDIQFFASTNSGGGPPIEFQIRGENYQQLDLAANELQEKLATYQGVYDIRNSLIKGKQEINLTLKPEAESLGLTLADLARQVRQGFYGAEAQRIQRGKDEVKVMIRYPENERRSVSFLENMYIRTPQGFEIPFSSVAEIRESKGYSSVKRVNQNRVISITADTDDANTDVDKNKIIKEIREDYFPELKKKYTSVNFGLEGSSLEENEAQTSLVKGFFLVLLMIYALMAIPLQSYSQPLLIMSVIPFGIIGAVVGHMVVGIELSILSMCGIIALSGVVVNDSLIMVDFVNKAVATGLNKLEAAKDAAVKRFRAIILTSLTTFFGLVPIVLETSLQAKIVQPMAISLAFGILFATVITLFLIPSLYLIGQDFKNLVLGAVHAIKPKKKTDDLIYSNEPLVSENNT